MVNLGGIDKALETMAEQREQRKNSPDRVPNNMLKLFGFEEYATDHWVHKSVRYDTYDSYSKLLGNKQTYCMTWAEMADMIQIVIESNHKSGQHVGRIQMANDLLNIQPCEQRIF